MFSPLAEQQTTLDATYWTGAYQSHNPHSLYLCTLELILMKIGDSPAASARVPPAPQYGGR